MSKDSVPLPPHYRYNFIVFLVDYICFGIAFTFISLTSVAPALVSRLTTSAPLIGLISTVFSGGWLLPQLLVANLINDKPRKKPYMIAALSGRVTIWIVALALWSGLTDHPQAMLVLFFVCLALFATMDGMASVSWFDIMARAIPVHRRGRLVSVGQFVSGLVGIGVGGLVGLILERYPFPGNFALLFTLAGVALIPSTVALCLIREPLPAERRDPHPGGHKGRWLQILVKDVLFLRFMLARLLVGMLGLAGSFYVLHAEHVLHLPNSVIGSFVAAQTLAGTVATAGLGLVSERWGSRAVSSLAGLAATAGPLFALVVHQVGSGWLVRAYPFVFMMLGVVNSAWMLGFTNYLLEIAPEEIRPTYVGLSNTIAGVVMMFVPVAGGWLLEWSSYPVLFGVTTLLTALGFLATLTLKPRERVACES
ncbi:MAG: MFS transporter [Anaerolineae bacterium]|nr:MFS transporter [Anaerolineae bacterium]